MSVVVFGMCSVCDQGNFEVVGGGMLREGMGVAPPARGKGWVCAHVNVRRGVRSGLVANIVISSKFVRFLFVMFSVPV